MRKPAGFRALTIRSARSEQGGREGDRRDKDKRTRASRTRTRGILLEERGPLEKKGREREVLLRRKERSERVK